MQKITIPLDMVLISLQSYALCQQLLRENPILAEYLKYSDTVEQFKDRVRKLAEARLASNPSACDFYYKQDHSQFQKLQWQDYATIRLLDYVHHAGKNIPTPQNIYTTQDNQSDPIALIWFAEKSGRGAATPDFFSDMIALFRQFSGRDVFSLPSRDKVLAWMNRHPSGLAPDVVDIRRQNRDRILRLIVEDIEQGRMQGHRFCFSPKWNATQKWEKVLEWWNDSLFHLRFAVRTPEKLQYYLGNSLSPKQMQTLYRAQQKGIPFFVTPYYLSLVHVCVLPKWIGTDQTIRDYILYSPELVDTFGSIVAWEKEDKVETGKPNVAGWLLPPGNNVHRRYPDVAILIPDGLGRTCGGLCSCCQRMYEFQQGSMHFSGDNKTSNIPWNERLHTCLEYFEQDPQIRDILITGGDALMLSDKNLESLLDNVYEMAARKQRANTFRTEEKYAEIVRIRLGTRLPVYIPQRITPTLTDILYKFQTKARKIGIQQFIVQTHFSTAMEITPESQKAVNLITSSGWVVTNQQVFTTPSSRRGHNAKLRQVLNQIGVIPYYTFTVKGYVENQHHFTPNARSVQEQVEEKRLGIIPEKWQSELKKLYQGTCNIARVLSYIQAMTQNVFVASDRNVLNLPGVGKSMTFRVIGITYDGRRILEFEYDTTRAHSPIIHKMGKIQIVESKSLAQYLRQLEQLGEDVEEYQNVYGYSLGETDPRCSMFDYPEYPFPITSEISNIQV